MQTPGFLVRKLIEEIYEVQLVALALPPLFVSFITASVFLFWKLLLCSYAIVCSPPDDYMSNRFVRARVFLSHGWIVIK